MDKFKIQVKKTLKMNNFNEITNKIHHKLYKNNKVRNRQ